MNLDIIADNLDAIALPDEYLELKERALESIELMTSIPESEWKDRDFEMVRSNIITISQMGTVAFQQISDLAQSNPTPRVYEVLATMMKSLVEINKEVIEIHKSRKDIQDQEVSAPSVVNNNLFVGSTEEMLDKLLSRQSSE